MGVRVTSSAEAKLWIEEFVRPKTKRFVLGCNDLAKQIASMIDVEAFVDDFSSDREFCGKPILRIEQLEPGSLVLSTSAAISPHTSLQKLEEAQCRSLDWFSFKNHSSFPIDEIPFWHGSPGPKELDGFQYLDLRARVADSSSVQTLDDLVQFRALHDLSAMRGYVRREQDQYFEPFLNLGTNEVFYDVGVFDGFTSVRFSELVDGQYLAIHAFEPSEVNRALAEKRCRELRRFHLWPFGLADFEKTVRFANSGSASKRDNLGTEEVRLRSLDELEIDPPTFIKVDIEGGERDFIIGAKATLAVHRPKIAIACYHRWDDVYVLAEMISEIVGPSSIFLRHYTEGYTETVLYFVPEPNHG